jgi:beta-N-acetylhexosaminidase
MVNLKAKPFNLSDDDIRWVETTLAGMGDDEKLGQLFCLIARSSDEGPLKNMAKNISPGGMMCRPMSMGEAVDIVRILQENSKIPMLVSANLEQGGNCVATEGTIIGSEMLVAATDDVTMAYKLGEVCGREGSAVGLNWSISPIIDLDYNFRNPITNTRTFGSDPDLVRRMGVQFVNAIQKHGVAACIKHFPGDGVDERDQHLVASINSLSCSEWDTTYGAIYRDCIDAGAMSVMVGHILLPAYTKQFTPRIKDEDILPASLSYELTTKLLKEKLGFNGLVVSDATTMAGMLISMPRSKAVPLVIAAGCDMFLFTRNLEEDLEYMKKGIDDGMITRERLNDALTRILAMKAALGLHKKKHDGTLVPDPAAAMKVLGCAEHHAWAEECADKGITLLKEEKGVLPLSPERYKKVLYYPIESEKSFTIGVRTGVVDTFKYRLVKEGFDIDQFVPPEGFEGIMPPTTTVTDTYDLIIYLANMATKSNQTVVRIEWAQPMGANVPIYIASVPTIFISVENPYHLLDVPRVRTYINAYCSGDSVLEALVDKLMGRSGFKGKSPVDPFCGRWDTKL